MKKQLTSAICILLMSSATALSHQNKKERVIETAAQLQYWCKSLSYLYFKRRRLIPYNWSARTIRKLNDFHTSGYWNVSNKTKSIDCYISKGLKAKYTKLVITDN